MNLWNYLAKQTLKDKNQIEQHLIKKLGKPTNELQTNLLSELTKKINSYYAEPAEQNYTTHSLIGSVQKISDRLRKTGKRKGQVDYVVQLANQEILQARKEDLPKDKWDQITKMTILGQNLVFKYRKWITNKQLLDFYSPAKSK